MDLLKLAVRLGWAVALALLALLTTMQATGAQTPTPGPPATPGVAPAISHALVGRSHCLICHAAGFGQAVKVPADHADYTNDTCQDCHQPAVATTRMAVESLEPGALPTPLVHPPAEGTNSCYDCHVLIDEKHAQISEEWQGSVHGKAGVDCADCHGGDPRSDEMNVSMAPETGFIGAPPRVIVPDVCGGCHADVERMRQYRLPTDQYVKYMNSVHGLKLKERFDTRVAVCVDCHGAHAVKKASDPSADVYPLNIPALCARCHSDDTLMEPYDIPTDQYEFYKVSVHGEALLNGQNLRAANCASCHGSHAAKPPNSAEVINVCGSCHTGTEDYYNESLHAKIGDSGPKCVTCHGAHDIPRPGEHMFVHASQLPERACTTCHLDEKSYRWDQSWFARPEDRRCDTCHHEGSMIMPQVLALQSALTEADQSYRQAEERIKQAQAHGMIVRGAEAKLAEARTDLIRARAVLHTTKLPAVGELTDAAKSAANTAEQIANDKLHENRFRRQAMIVAIGAIGVNIGVLYVIKRELDQQLEAEDEARPNVTLHGS